MAKGNRDNAISGNVSFTSGRLLARNTIFNLIGQGAPMVIALFAIPLLIKGLGTDRFGVLTLAWVIVGYFSLFDLGLGRALTKVVAEKLGSGQHKDIPVVVWTTLLLMIAFGLLGAILLAALAHWLVNAVLKVPDILKSETVNTFYLLAISIPIVISTAGLRGVLEAQQRFDLVNIVRFFMGTFTFLGPLLVLPFSKSLFAVVCVLVIGRFLAWLAHLFFCFLTMPELKWTFTVDRAVLKPLIQFGSWMTVTNIISPLMVYIDRFLIGALLSITAVAYYTTPYEMVTKLLIIPGAVVGVLLPAFATSFVHERELTARLFLRAIKYIFIVMFPIAFIIVLFAHEGLMFWLGPEFAQNSAGVLQWLAVGTFINGMAQVSFVLIQGVGRPDLTAKIHSIELPFYLIIAWWLIGSFGIKGAAFAWLVRVLLDSVLLLGIAQKFLPISASNIRNMAVLMTAALIVLATASLTNGVILKGFVLLGFLCSFASIVWFLILAADERIVLKNHIRTK